MSLDSCLVRRIIFPLLCSCSENAAITKEKRQKTLFFFFLVSKIEKGIQIVKFHFFSLLLIYSFLKIIYTIPPPMLDRVKINTKLKLILAVQSPVSYYSLLVCLIHWGRIFLYNFRQGHTKIYEKHWLEWKKRLIFSVLYKGITVIGN